MSGPSVHVGGATWSVHPDDAEGLADRLLDAADRGAATKVRVLTDDGGEADLVVSPAFVPVVVSGGAPSEPAQTFPQR